MTDELDIAINNLIGSWAEDKPNMNTVLGVEEDALFKAHAAFDKAFYIDDLSSHDALRKAILAYEWALEQPMDTAPRDGTCILLYNDDNGWAAGYYAKGDKWYLYAKDGWYATTEFDFWRPDLKAPLVKE